jgi:membrane protein YdbS with pleckstrin-like domain
MADVRLHPEGPPELENYLIAGEKIIFVTHRHWITLVEPSLTALASFFLVLVVTAHTTGRATFIVFLIWLIVALRAAGLIADHRYEWFLATDKRLMLVHGLVTRKVDIMPMGKVTDMRFDKSLTGRLLGYGVFVLESAGQDQALSRINFLPDADRRYQQISSIIFGLTGGHLRDYEAKPSPGTKIPVTDLETRWWRRS